jgi:tetratricopeptide (TPR) repeat protein
MHGNGVRKRPGLRACLALAMAGGIQMSGIAAEPADKALVQRAHLLVNDYYGDRSDLEEAAALVDRALAVNPRSADAYVEAARITSKGGHIVSYTFAPGTREMARQLIDQALKLDPRQTQALSLLAEDLLLKGQTAQALVVIDKGLAIAPEQPWLNLKLADYWERQHQPRKAIEIYETIGNSPRCAQDPEYRRACEFAMESFAGLLRSPANVAMLRAIAARVDELRHPKDAWALGNLADILADADDWDQALVYARKAHSIMDYGVGRRILAVTLYTQAAIRSGLGKPDATLLAEADALGISEESVLDWFKYASDASRRRADGVVRLFAQRARVPPLNSTSPPPRRG